MSPKPTQDELAARVRQSEARETRDHEGEAPGVTYDIFRHLAQTMDQGVGIADGQGRILFVNLWLAQKMGYEPEELAGKMVTEILDPVDHPTMDRVQDRLTTGQSIQQELLLIKKDGSRLSLAISAKPFLDDQGRINGSLVTFAKIKSEKAAEKALARSEKKFKDLLDNANEAIVVIQDGETRLFNKKTLEISGYSADHLTSRQFIEFIHPDDREAVLRRHLSRLSGEDVPSTYVIRIIDSLGNTRWTELHSVLVQWDGRPATMNFFTEVTRRREAERRLAEQERKYAELVRHAPAGIIEMDFNTGRIISANQVISQYTGYGLEELLGMSVFDMLGSQGQEELLARMGEASQGGRAAMAHEYQVRKKDGSLAWVLANVNHIFKDGRPYISRVVLSDITENKLTIEVEAVGRDLGIALGSTSSLTQAMDLILDAAILMPGVDCGGIYLVDEISGHLSLAAHRGLSPEFIDKVSFYDADSRQAALVRAGNPLIHQSHDHLAPQMDRVREKEGLKSLALFPITHQGRVTACINLASRTKEELPRAVISALGAFANQMGSIIARVRAEQQMRQSEEKYRALVENATDAIFIIQNQKVLFPNPAAINMLGYSAKELSETPFWELIHPQDREKAAARHQNRMKGNKSPRGGTYRMLHKDGRTVVVSANGMKIDWEGRPAVLMFATDITEQKKMEQQIEQAQRLEAVASLAGGVAHDFNNLLMAIGGNTSLALLETPQDHPLYPRLSGIEQCVQSGTRLTAQLLGYAKGGKYSVEKTDLNHVVTSATAMFGRAKKEIQVQLELDPELWTVEADQGQVEQVLVNMFLNAWHAMGKKGRIMVTTANTTVDQDSAPLFGVETGKFARISVRDSGAGMDAATQKRIFEPFFTTRETGKGVGLGLASAYGIVKNHGGAIRVYSELGKGSTFHVYLPAIGADSKRTGPGIASEPEDPLVMGQGTIMVVDDEAEVLEVAASMLEKMGYRVLTAANGKDALQIYADQGEDIDLVLLDIIMPEMSGGEIFEALLAADHGVRVLLCSGYSLDDQAQDMVARGCRGFIQKPFNISQFSRKIHEALQKPTP